MSSVSTGINRERMQSPSASTWECALLGFSALLIFVAWDDNFNMQVMAPFTVLLLGGYLAKTRGAFTDIKLFKLCLLILGSCGVSLLSCLAFNSEAISTKSVIRFLYIALILLFVLVTVDRRYTRGNLNLIVWGNIIAGAVIGLGIIARYMGGVAGKIAVANIWGVAVEENYMASLMAFELVLAVTALRYTKGMGRKLIIAALAAINLLGIVLSGSRAAMLGALAAIALLLFLYLVMGSAGGFVTRFLGLAVLVLAGFFVVGALNDSIPVWYLDRFFHNSYLDSSNVQRIHYWTFGLEGFMARPLFGYGVGNYAYYVDAQMWSGGGDVVVAHNTYIDALVDTGLIGAALFAVLIVSNFKRAWKQQAFIPLLFVAFFTSFIVGGERTFFFWNSVVLLSIFARYAASQDDVTGAMESIFNLSSSKRFGGVANDGE